MPPPRRPDGLDLMQKVPDTVAEGAWWQGDDWGEASEGGSLERGEGVWDGESRLTQSAF